MPKIFIAWGGNKQLANEVAKLFDGTEYTAVVGGDNPTDMYVGTQVIDQIKECNRAILLVEDYGGQLSHNLVFEWGYMVACKNIDKLHIFMINKSQRELPSDLLGVWVKELKRDLNDADSDKTLAKTIYLDFMKEEAATKNKGQYFDIINNWQDYRRDFAKTVVNLPLQRAQEVILFGCLAAYYYGDNNYLKEQFSSITGSEKLNNTVMFAKYYVDVFLKSGNMSHSIPTATFFECCGVFEDVISYLKEPATDMDTIQLILCYDVYGLACRLYLKNDGLDEEIITDCKNKSFECYAAAIDNLERFDERIPDNDCFFHLIRAYLFNDLADFYQDFDADNPAFKENLEKSVKWRQNLYRTFQSSYPDNTYLASKLEQEYMIAFSKQCLFSENKFMLKVSVGAIKAKLNDWRAEADYTFSLINRLERNVELLDKKLSH